MSVRVDFWREYANAVRDSGVPEQQVEWFQRWIERFSRNLRGVSLRDRSVEDVTAFIEDLKADERLAPWQVEQARNALRILYRDVFGLNAKTMSPRGATSMRDSVIQPRQLEALHGALLDRVRDAIRLRHYSPRTETAYVDWTKRFISFHDLSSPCELDASHIRTFLTYLATERHVASSTQNQALNAIVFLFVHVLDRDPGDFSGFERAKVPKRKPDTLSREQITRLIDSLKMPYRLIAVIMYGAGLRVTECLSLRVQDIRLDDGTIHGSGRTASPNHSKYAQCGWSSDARGSLVSGCQATGSCYVSGETGKLKAESRFDSPTLHRLLPSDL